MSLSANGRATRRELAASGIAAVAVLTSAPAAFAGSPEPGDARLLGQALEVEQLVVIAYRRALASGALTGVARARVEAQLTQELDHVATLERELRLLAGAIPAPPAGTAAAQSALKHLHVASSLLELPDQHACLRLLIEVETLAEAAYFAAVTGLSESSLTAVCVAAMGCEAQHWTVLSDLQHDDDVTISVPYPFVRGSSGY